MATKLMTSRTHSGTFPSPGTPPCSQGDSRDLGIPKGWCSERVPGPGYRARRYVAAAALMPFSSGRALPSKWDDAERWISSPVSASAGNFSTHYYGNNGPAKPSQLAQAQRRAKSKSGPLGPAGLGFYGGYNTFSPVLGVGVINGRRWRNSVAIESPASAQAGLEERLAADGCDGGGGGRRSCPGLAGPEWLDLWSGSFSPSRDHKIEIGNNNNQNDNGEAGVDRIISRRDMATQMFHEGESNSHSSVASSPNSWISTNSPPRPLANEPKENTLSPEFEIRDVEVDNQTSRTTTRFSPDMPQVRENSSSSTSTDRDNKLSKLQREEARINAWENLQKAKAEAAIQKLEVKLEKKRASSMKRIIEKLHHAEIKAQKIRNSLSNVSDHEIQSRAISKTIAKIPSFCRKIRLSSSSSARSCSTCYPF